MRGPRPSRSPLSALPSPCGMARRRRGDAPVWLRAHRLRLPVVEDTVTPRITSSGRSSATVSPIGSDNGRNQRASKLGSVRMVPPAARRTTVAFTTRMTGTSPLTAAARTRWRARDTRAPTDRAPRMVRSGPGKLRTVAHRRRTRRLAKSPSSIRRTCPHDVFERESVWIPDDPGPPVRHLARSRPTRQHPGTRDATWRTRQERRRRDES
jgi:hypothetical protein